MPGRSPPGARCSHGDWLTFLEVDYFIFVYILNAGIRVTYYHAQVTIGSNYVLDWRWYTGIVFNDEGSAGDAARPGRDRLRVKTQTDHRITLDGDFVEGGSIDEKWRMAAVGISLVDLDSDGYRYCALCTAAVYGRCNVNCSRNEL